MPGPAVQYSWTDLYMDGWMEEQVSAALLASLYKTLDSAPSTARGGGRGNT